MPRILPPVFDPEKILIGYEHSSYNVKYTIFYSEADTSNMDRKDWKSHAKYAVNNTGSTACFSKFMHMFNCFILEHKKNKIRPNRLRFFCKPRAHTKSEVQLSNDEIRRWVELCKQNKIMPDSIGEEFVVNHDFDIDIDNISINMMYVYLCSARYVQDEPFFVRAVVHMIDDCDMGFFTSLGVATRFCTTNSGHHLIDLARNYSVPGNKEKLNDESFAAFNTFDLILPIKLALFVNGGDKGPKLKDIDKLKYSFGLHNKLSAIPLNKHSFIVHRKDLKRKRLERILRTGELELPLIVGRKKKCMKNP